MLGRLGEVLIQDRAKPEDCVLAKSFQTSWFKCFIPKVCRNHCSTEKYHCKLLFGGASKALDNRYFKKPIPSNYLEIAVKFN